MCVCGIAMLIVLLKKIKETCTTRVKSRKKISHEYSTIIGIEESVHGILMILKEIVLRNTLNGTWGASICFKGVICFNYL